MIRNIKRWNTFLRLAHQAAAFALILSLAACSSSSRSPNTIAPQDTATPPTFDTDFGGGSTVDDSTLPDLDSLFDTDLSAEETIGDPAVIQDLPPQSPEQFSCLSQDAAFGFPNSGVSTIPSGSNTNTGGSSTFDLGASFMVDPFGSFNQGLDPMYQQQVQGLTCLNPNQGGFNQSMLYGAALQGLGLMSTCVQIAAANPPPQNASPQQVQYYFAVAQMAMIRCFRAINQQQSQNFNWAGPQVAGFQQTDQSLLQLLNVFNTGSVGGNSPFVYPNSGF